MRKMRRSTIQTHANCRQIDIAIAAGERLSVVAARHGVTSWAVARRRDMLRRDFDGYLRALAPRATEGN